MRNSPCHKEYRLIRLISEDRDKRVFAAWQEGKKVLVKEAVRQTDAGLMLEREAALLSELDAPPVPVLYGFEKTNELYRLEEEFIEGETLESFLEHNPRIGAARAMAFATSLCDGIGALQKGRERYVHCDLKPSNLIVSGNTLRIVDFGAAVKEGEESLGISSYGSPGFFAPEQSEGEMRTPATDIYAAGMVLKLIFERVRHKGPKRKRIENVIKTATDENPSCRFQNAKELKAALTGKGRHGGKHADDDRMPESIGIIGTHRGAGVTHLAVALASYLGESGCRTALVDMSGTGDLSCLAQKEKELPLRFAEGVRILEAADRSLRADPEKTGCAISVFDLGCGVSSLGMSVFEKCDVQIIVTDSAPWRSRRRLMVERIGSHADKRTARLLVNFMGNSKPGDLRRLSLLYERGVYDPDPFSPGEQSKKLFKRLLSAV